MNPFKENGAMLPIASINSLFVDDTTAYDLFRPQLLLEEIENNKDELGLNSVIQEDLFDAFNGCLASEIDSIKWKANEIAIEFGDRLAKVLSTLKKPSELSVNNRTNWTKEHWDYWKTIKRLYLVGGLTSPLLTKIFLERIKMMFKEKEIKDFHITFVEGSINLGTKGLSTLCGNGEFLLFDFGQTNIKRAHHIKESQITVLDHYLPTIKSDYLFYKFKDDEELLQIAKLLDNYILNVILNTMKEVGFKGHEVLMSIANYVNNGVIFKQRGGYGKLALLCDSYEIHLSERLSQVLDRKITVKLHHDTSAMAYSFKNNEKTAVISLGTAFGVAFVE
jgi:hypothetical protein